MKRNKRKNIYYKPALNSDAKKERAFYLDMRQQLISLFRKKHGLEKSKEAVSIALTKFIENGKNLDDPKAKGWLILTTRNILIDEYRIATNIQTHQAEMINSIDAYDDPNNKIDAFDREVITKVINNNIDKLSPRVKEVIKAIMDGKNDEEIAKSLNITESTVRDHRCAAISKLKEQLKRNALS